MKFADLLDNLDPALAEKVHRRDTLEKDFQELLTAVEPDGARLALAALYELHVEDTRLILEMIRR